MISPLAWFTAPLFTYFWVYQGWSLWRVIRFFIFSNILIAAFTFGPITGIIVVLWLGIASWVYGDAERRKIKFSWFYSTLNILFPIVGLVIYSVRVWFHRRELIRSGKIINDPDGQIIFR